jgi:hypothetical protein
MLKLLREMYPLLGGLRSKFAKLLKRRTPTLEEIVLAGSRGEEPSKEYLEALSMFDNVVRDCMGVSRQYAGIQAPSQRHFYASVLFTTLITRGVSLVTLAPHSPWSQKLVEHWDYASAAIIVRTMMELRAAFFYLCADQASDEEWSCRWELLCLHDCCARIRTLEASPSGQSDLSNLMASADEFRNRLKENKFFQNLRHQARFLNGGVAYIYPIEDILQSAGLEKSTYKLLNTIFSSHVHGLPMSYFRMAQEERGRGLPSPVEESSTTICLILASALLTATKDEVIGVFEGISGRQTDAPDSRQASENDDGPHANCEDDLPVEKT